LIARGGNGKKDRIEEAEGGQEELLQDDTSGQEGEEV
jgi:hypothetical protein